MAITAGQDILASDFVSTSSGASDSGKVAKLNASGFIPRPFIPATFGGTGADGALSLTSGTTTLAMGAVAVYVKNYTSISITGTGKLAFSGPHANGTSIILRSQGNVTLTAAAPCIDASGMGALGGAATVASLNYTGTVGNAAYGFGLFKNNNGAGGPGVGGGSSSGGALPTALSLDLVTLAQYTAAYPYAVPGAGGGAGGSPSGTGSWTSGAGGNGGGVLIIECAGAWNFTTASGITVAGLNGGNGALVSTGNSGGGGGGGGGGGVFICLYDTLTANSGTVVVSGGTGGNTGAAAGQGTGGGGGSGIRSAGGGGSQTSNGVKGGGDGGTGYSVIEQNTTRV